MPRSELHPLAEGTLPSTQPRMTTALPNLASMSDGGFVELVWENGQLLLLRGASTTTQKSPSCIGISSHTSNAVENVGGDSFNTKSARYESRDSPLLGPPALKELSKHDKNMPYLNYPHTDSLQEYAYLPELLNESYEPTPNALTQHYDAAVLDKSSRHNKQLMDSNIVSLHDNLNLKQRKTFKFLGAEPQLTKPRSSQLYRSSLQHCQSSAPFTRSQGLDFTCGNTNSSHLLIPPSSTLVSMGGLCNSKMQQDPGPKRKMGLANFSHSLRPSIQSSGGTKPTTSPGLSRVEELKNTGFQNQPVSMATKAELIQSIAKSPKEPLPDENSEAVCQEDVSRKNGSPNHVLGRASSFATSAAKGNPNSEKSIKPLVATSSFCSHGASNDPIYYSKRKYQDGEESAYLSENVEEPEDVIKTVLARGNTGAKRGRTAEVHNLSERRRRDKINKKIRALRELIPNCNKVDKASMLDEVIEYLKTLQLQIQIMSMRTGLCMPPMMLPTGMQHIHVPHLTHFSPMGVGMGMRVGMGTCFSPAQFPSFISGATALPGITGTTLQMLGLPSQMLPMSSSCPPFIPLPVGSSTQSLPVPVVSGATSPVEHLPSTPTPCSKVSIQKISLDTLHNEKILNAQGTKQRVR